VPGAQDYRTLDDRMSRTVSGDGGGAYAPSSPVIIGGAGMQFITTGTLFTGNVSTGPGGRVLVDAVAGNSPKLTSAGTDVIVLSMTDMQVPLGGSTISGNYSWLPDDYLAVSTVPSTVGAQSVYGGQYMTLTIPGRSLHASAQLVKIILHYRVVTKPPAFASASPLSFAIVGWDSATDSYSLLAPAATSWLPSTVYPVGTYILPQTVNATGFYYKATAIAGTGTSSSTTQPTWPTVVGATVIDNPGANQITWTCVGLSGQLLPSSNASTYYNDGQPQSLELDFDPNNLPTVDVAQTAYQILVSGAVDVSGSTAPFVNILLHSVEFHFGGILLLGFE
jgi:hypothetical protein